MWKLNKLDIAFLILPIFATLLFFWLSLEFRPDGVLGLIQKRLEWIYFFPYLLSTAIDGGPHNIGYFGFTLGLLLEFFIAASLIRLFVIKLYTLEHGRTLTIAASSFFLGAIIMLVVRIDEKIAEIIFSAAATLAAAFFGAKYAFSLQNKKQENEQISKRVEAGNRAIFKIVNIYTKFCNFRDQFINEYRNHPLRYLAIKPEIGMDVPNEIDFDSLSFLFQSKDPNILGELSLFQAEVQSTVSLIKSRSDFHMRIVQPKLEAAGKEYDDLIPIDQIRNILGTQTHITLVQNTNQMIEFTDGIISASWELIEKLRSLLKEMFKGHLIIGFKRHDQIIPNPNKNAANLENAGQPKQK